jgi:rod shape-determining protein MreD
LWFSVPSQAAQILPLFFLAHVVELVLRMLGGGTFPGMWMFLAPLLEAVLWPIASVFLLAPQRRAPDPDANRPL